MVIQIFVTGLVNIPHSFQSNGLQDCVCEFRKPTDVEELDLLVLSEQRMLSYEHSEQILQKIKHWLVKKGRSDGITLLPANCKQAF